MTKGKIIEKRDEKSQECQKIYTYDKEMMTLRRSNGKEEKWFFQTNYFLMKIIKPVHLETSNHFGSVADLKTIMEFRKSVGFHGRCKLLLLF